MLDVTYIAFESFSEAEEASVDGKVPIGRPVFNTEVYLRKEPGSEHGEILVASLNVAGGYIHANEEQARRFIPNQASAE